jgi:hypothetical protein
MTVEMVKGDTFSKDYSGQVLSICSRCLEALQDLQHVIEEFKALPNNSRVAWSRMKFESSDFAEIEQRLQTASSMVTDLNLTLSKYNTSLDYH